MLRETPSLNAVKRLTQLPRDAISLLIKRLQSALMTLRFIQPITLLFMVPSCWKSGRLRVNFERVLLWHAFPTRVTKLRLTLSIMALVPILLLRRLKFHKKAPPFL